VVFLAVVKFHGSVVLADHVVFVNVVRVLVFFGLGVPIE
jgi:hypothetical protein